MIKDLDIFDKRIRELFETMDDMTLDYPWMLLCGVQFKLIEKMKGRDSQAKGRNNIVKRMKINMSLKGEKKGGLK